MAIQPLVLGRRFIIISRIRFRGRRNPILMASRLTLAIQLLQELAAQKEPFFLSVGYYRPHLPFNAPKKYWDMYNRDEERQREIRHGYYASVSLIDAQVGRLLNELDQLGVAENTIVVLWGDHGWKLSEHNRWCKQGNYEIDTRSPLIVSRGGGEKRRIPE